MDEVTVGLMHPGEMGAALGSALRNRGTVVLWASSGRSSETTRRAELAGLHDAGSVQELLRQSDAIVSVCPPHAAIEVARSINGFDGMFVDVNAVSPATARTIAAIVENGGGRCVDGGVVGPPPRSPGTTRLYLSGPLARRAAALFAGSTVDTRVISEELGAASALKMAYAAWTKGTAALLLAIRALARTEGVEAALLDEWRTSLPDLPDDSLRAARAACIKGWRWVGEMEEVAATFKSVSLPDSFHQGAREIFSRVPRREAAERDQATLEKVLVALAKPGANVDAGPS
ncbi:MAG TPA: DUF1932 domain-containing protein [Actinomycetota bacterium]|jgi:3-hydroxyisobutyrate dehydrogenase-like beta-hydroxyacid dehydrogenase|nr:DUF1932 domain-containing protein [Actinomycetota bacterium]